jgi:hypothetical protein
MASEHISSRQLTSIVIIHFLTILLYIVGAAEELVERRNTRRQWFKQRKDYIRELRDSPPDRMKGIFRVTPAQFDKLLEELATKRRFPLRDLPSASIAIQLGIFLAFVGPANTYRSIAEIFGCNKYIISVSIHRVLRTLVSRY